MAELNTSGPKKKDASGKKVRAKQDAHVDLTAMVDLAFLLITFFMLTTSLSKPQSMNLAMPDKSQEAKEEVSLVAETRTVTLLLGTNNQLVWYLGQFDAPRQGPEVINYGRDGLRRVLLEMQQYVQQIAHTEERTLIVIIKPSDKSTYRNLIDALDEMVITGVGQYAIVEITPEELDLLTEKGLN